MTPVSALQTLYPWNLQLNETPPRARTGLYAALGAGIGARTLDILRHNRIPVSPVLACAMHMQYLIPVYRDQDGAWLLDHEPGCQLTHTSECSAPVRMGEPVVHGRLWMLPPDGVAQSDRTNMRDLYEAYHLQRRARAAAVRVTAEPDVTHEPAEPLIAAAA